MKKTYWNFLTTIAIALTISSLGCNNEFNAVVAKKLANENGLKSILSKVYDTAILGGCSTGFSSYEPEYKYISELPKLGFKVIYKYELEWAIVSWCD